MMFNYKKMKRRDPNHQKNHCISYINTKKKIKIIVVLVMLAIDMGLPAMLIIVLGKTMKPF